MKKFDILKLVNTLGVPVLIIALGCIMLIHPDSASALIANLIGWVLVVASGAFAARTLLDKFAARGPRLFCAIAGLLCGIWLLNHPLALASTLGRFLGALLLYRGGRDLYTWWKQKQTGNFVRFPLLPGITTGAGLILFFLPLSASRLLFTVVGLILVAIGIGELYDRIRSQKLLEEPDDPNIIDAL